jgi:type I restriction enzyme S subunit
MSDLPSSWAVVKLGDFVENEKGKKPKNESKIETTSHSLPYVDIQAFEEKVVRTWTDGVSCRLCYETDFLMVWDGSRSGLVGKGMNGALGSTLVRIYFPSMVNEYAFYFLQSKYQQINTRAKGVGIPHVDPALLWNYDFPIAPLPEQHRIVAKIEELFSELDKGIENLKTAQAQLKVYRQALLKHAFEGKLTAQWREQNRDKLETADALLKRIQQERAQRYQQQLADWEQSKSPSIPLLQRGKTSKTTTLLPPFESGLAGMGVFLPNSQKGGLGGICRPISKPQSPKTLPPLTADELAELPELPEGWIYAYLSDLGELGRGKSKHRPRNDPLLFGGIYPFVQTGEVKAANRIIRQYSQTLSDFGLQQSKLWATGTLCITIAANIAETAFLGFDGCFPDSVVGFSAFKKTIFPEYIDFFIQAARARIEAYAPATAQKNINLETLENLVVPYCSVLEQKLILDILEERYSIADQLDQTITNSLQQAEALRQSILKKAFSGQLVPQDPQDEPASALLARIKAEQATAEKRSVVRPGRRKAGGG